MTQFSLDRNCGSHHMLTDWNATRLALETLPVMDGLVNNAALAICKPFLEVPPEDIDL